MIKTILLTRSKEDNRVLSDKFIKQGYKCVECSLLSHSNLRYEEKILEKYNNIIVTSRRAARLAPSGIGKKAWVVGSASAKILQDKGYEIKYIAENALNLKEQIPRDIYLNTIYLAGDKITINMSDEIKTTQVYSVTYKDSLTLDEIKSIRNGLDYILLYSENCAKTLLKLLVQNNLLKYLEDTAIIAISSKVGNVVKNYFKKIVISKDLKIYEKIL